MVSAAQSQRVKTGQITAEEFTADFEHIKTDAFYRVTCGKFYKIMIKGDDDEEEFVIPFIPNEIQMQILRRLWYRMDIPKARQFGVTTLFAILWLDHALFISNQRCGIVAHNLKAAGAIFRDKVKFGYNNLPDFMREMFPLEADRADELLFAHNNSSIQVATSLRSGTTHRLHVSEFGKICAKYPEHAKEVMTGSIPSVPMNGMLTIESTGEGPEGYFFNITMRAKKAEEAGLTLTKRQYRLFFIPWWKHQDYRMPAGSTDISPEDEKYFDQVEADEGILLDQEQCEWYVATRDADYYEEPELMWQEYPSTLAEVFQKSKEGHWFARQMTMMRKSNRIKDLPVELTAPCWTFWDIGSTDGTAIWVVQKVGHEYRVIRFYEAWDEPYAHAVNWLQDLGLVFDTHYLPHDASHVRQGQTSNKSPEQMLQGLLPGARFEVLDAIENITWGIQQTRDVFHMLWIDKTWCKEGIIHLDQYKKKFDRTQQRFIDVPLKTDGHSEAADAIRQFGQAYASGALNVRKAGSKQSKRANWKTA